MNIFLGSIPGFNATIKAKFNHFLVDEISNFEETDGRLSSDQTSVIIDQSSILKRRAEQTSSIPSKRSKTETNVPTSINFECDIGWCKTFLQEKLSKSVFSNLQNFAKVALDNCRNKNIDPLKIGTFSVKLDRLLLHCSISYLFPQLKTITTPRSDIITADINGDFQQFQNLIGVEQTESLMRFVLVERLEKYKNSVTIEGEYSKEIRRQIHHLIGSSFGKFVETKTWTGNDGKSRIVVRIKQRKKKENTKESDDITAFTLWKKNTETHSAMQQLSMHLQLRPHMFKYAGIKDKRAITTQCCTVSGIGSERFQKECESLPSHLRVSNIRPVSRAICLGELAGNHFTIRLSNVHRLKQCETKTSVRKVVESALEEVKTTGFINYFGPQRFGRKISSSDTQIEKRYSPNEEAPIIGLAMLRGDFKRAIDVLLSPVENVTSPRVNDAEEAKAYFQSTADIAGALERMPRHKIREISILRTLRRYGTTDNHAYVKALMGLTHSARLFYVHSFCSWIWNKIAALRIQRYGRKVVTGDLALKKDSDILGTNSEANKKKVFVVTDEDILLRRVELGDVVLTVPGNRVMYAPNMKDEYMKYFQFYEPTGDIHNDSSTESQKFRIPELKLNAPGTYRKLLEFPLNLSHRFLGFHKSPITERLSDTLKTQSENLDTIECEVTGVSAEEVDGLSSGAPPLACGKEHSNMNREKLTISTLSNNTDLKYNSGSSDLPQCQVKVNGAAKNLPVCDVEIEFDLPPSCYATTFINELTKGNMNC
ncbi:pseudouridylate synthase PUS7L-like [Styela clava]